MAACKIIVNVNYNLKFFKNVFIKNRYEKININSKLFLIDAAWKCSFTD